MLPTTIAPRYGQPTSLAPHQTPEYTLSADLSYSLRIQVQGILAHSHITSPSHAITQSTSKGVLIQLATGMTALDRDFVLNFHHRASSRLTALAQADFDGYVALASFKPELGHTQDPSPRSIKLVIDCSGSMGGDSIAQARIALMRILDTLRSQDYFNIVAFGSHHMTLFPRQLPASDENVHGARQFVEQRDADMGGTEMAAALQAAYALPCQADIPQDLLLITDGEIWDSEATIAQGQHSEHRIFTVGVGSAVAEPFVRTLATACGGACELVSPNEDMAGRIHRHFQRIYSPYAATVTVDWPKPPVKRFPQTLGPIFEGDTVHLHAWFDTEPAGEITASISLPDGEQFEQLATIAHFPDATPTTDAITVGTLPRLAASHQLRGLEQTDKATELATRYQLMSQWTHYLVIDVRDDDSKAHDLPALRKTPHTLAAGWGGIGTVMNCTLGRADIVHADLNRSSLRLSESSSKSARAPASDDIDIPMFLPRQSGDETPADKGPRIATFIDRLNHLPSTWLVPELRFDDLDALRQAGLATAIFDELVSIVDRGHDEQTVVLMFLYVLVKSKMGKQLHRDVARSIRKAHREKKLTSSTDKSVETDLAGLLTVKG
jgi:Ca-activated chloride channel family protein